jgi:hypothetical protein
MNDFGCDRETNVLDALRSGDLSPELLSHVSQCVACTDLMLVSQFLQSQSNGSSEPGLPDASLIWRKAQLRRRREALARATWPIRAVRGVAAMASIVATLWIVFGATKPLSWLSELGHYRLPAEHILNGQLTIQLVLIAGVCTLICAGVGAFYLLLGDRAEARLDRELLS